MKNNLNIYKNNQKGQVVLLLIIITVIGLTVALSLVARTVTDIRITSQVEQSTRAFSAAEAGIENALTVLKNQTVETNGEVAIEGAEANYRIANHGAISQNETLHFPLTQTTGSVTVWLAPHSDLYTPVVTSGLTANNTFNICFGTSGTEQPALLITLYYWDVSAGYYMISKTAFDSNATRGNNFEPVSSPAVGQCDGRYAYYIPFSPVSYGLAVEDNMIMLRIQPLYASTTVGFQNNAAVSLPLQGTLITSVGKTATNVVRKIEVIQTYPVLPSFLDFALFSAD